MGSPLPLWDADWSEENSLFLTFLWETERGHAEKRGSRVDTMAWLVVEKLQCPEVTVKCWGRDEGLDFLGEWSVGLGTRVADLAQCCHFCKYCLTAGKKPPFFGELVVAVCCAGRLLTVSHSTRTLWCAPLQLQPCCCRCCSWKLQTDGSASVGF